MDKQDYINILSESTCPQQSILIAYQENRLTDNDAHTVERHLVVCELCETRVEMLALGKGPALQNIKSNIQNQFVPAANKSFYYWGAAALIPLLIAIGIFNLKTRNENQLVVHQNNSATQDIDHAIYDTADTTSHQRTNLTSGSETTNKRATSESAPNERKGQNLTQGGYTVTVSDCNGCNTDPIQNDEAITGDQAPEIAEADMAIIDKNGNPSDLFSEQITVVEETELAAEPYPSFGKSTGHKSKVKNGLGYDSRPYELMADVTIKPTFPNGSIGLKVFMNAFENRIHLKGQADVNFIVNKNGKISAIKIVKVEKGASEIYTREFIESMPRWNPGKSGSEKVDVLMKLHWNFDELLGSD